MPYINILKKPFPCPALPRPAFCCPPPPPSLSLSLSLFPSLSQLSCVQSSEGESCWYLSVCHEESSLMVLLTVPVTYERVMSHVDSQYQTVYVTRPIHMCVARNRPDLHCYCYHCPFLSRMNESCHTCIRSIKLYIWYDSFIYVPRGII